MSRRFAAGPPEKGGANEVSGGFGFPDIKHPEAENQPPVRLWLTPPLSGGRRAGRFH